MKKVSYDSRRPCQPIVEPSHTREQLRIEADRYNRASAVIEAVGGDPRIGREVADQYIARDLEVAHA